MSTSSPTSTQPGWYADPQSPGQLRWFDGETWSPFTKEGTTEAAPAPAAMPAVMPQQRVEPARSTAPAPAPQPAPRPVSAAAPVPTPASAPTPAPALVPTTPSPAMVGWPSDVGRPSQGLAALATAPAPTVESFTVTGPPTRTVDRGPTPLRRLVGRWATSLPAWLPEPVADRLATRMGDYASRTDRLSDRLTGASLKELVFPLGSAWQGSVAACLGLLTVVLSVWPLVGLGAWVVTCVFAAWALLRIRRDVLLGGTVHAWFGVACGIGPLWTGLLMLAYR